jgi:peptidoglycan/LPS O-acetylase OafA/YrhL
MKLDKLESMRGFAGVYVILDHLFSFRLHQQGHWIGQPYRLAADAVLIFFFLSGFVIYYSWHNTDGDFRLFFYKRFRRIYPIFILSMLVAYVVACLSNGFQYPPLGSILGNLLMVQSLAFDVGWRVNPFMNNDALWSLSYEWWFYMMFYPIYVYVPVPWQKWLVGAIALFGIGGVTVAPNIFFHIMAAFPIWWCGVEFAREYVATGNMTLRNQSGMLAIMAVVLLAQACVLLTWIHHGRHVSFFSFPLEKFRQVADSLGLIVLFFAWKKIGFKGFAYTFGPFHVFAGISYALYVIHFPILCLLPTFTTPPTFWDIAGRLVFIFILAWLAEQVWQKHLNRWMDRWFYGKKRKVLA